MGFNESDAAKEDNTSVGTPRLRVNKTTSLTLNTTPTTVIYNGSSAFNNNTFLKLPGQTNKSVWYDTATGLFKFTANADKNYYLDMSFSVTTSGLLAIGLSNIAFRLQLEIPSPTPIKFPLPDFGGYVDVDNVNFNGQKNLKIGIPFFAETNIRQYGFAVKAYLSSTLISTAMLNGGDVNLYPLN